MKPNVARDRRIEAVKQAILTIEKRVNELGVAEPVVAPYGTSGDQIVVQLPGVTDVAHAKSIIRSTARLEIKLVEGVAEIHNRRFRDTPAQGQHCELL